MNDNNKLLSMLEDVDEDLDNETRQEISQIWQQLSEADPAESITVSEQQTQNAYQKVKNNIDPADHKTGSISLMRYSKYAAVAVFLLAAVALAYILIPITISTPHGQTQTVTLPDESIVELNSGSQISYSRLFGLWDREVHLQGEAFFDVHSNGTTFHVTTDNASITVVGTKFNVRNWPSEADNRTSVFLSEGKVTFKSLLTDTDPVILTTGEQSWISDEQQHPADPVTIDSEKAVGWQHNSMMFEDQPLSTVFGELERRFDVSINSHPNVMNEQITIYLSDIEKAETAIKDICRAKGLTYKKQNEKFLIYRN